MPDASTRPAVSVAMATYNGAAYVEEQVRSILAQLGEHDELVVVDGQGVLGGFAVVAELHAPQVELLVDPAERRVVELERVGELVDLRRRDAASLLAPVAWFVAWP